MRFDELWKVRDRFSTLNRWRGHTMSGFTGTMAAGLAANSTVGFVRNDGSLRAHVAWMHLHFICLAGFTTPVTASRRLSLRRGTGLTAVTPWGGTLMDGSKDYSDSTETVLTGAIATTGALTMTGNTYESATRRRLLVSHVGNAGQDYDELWQLDNLFLKQDQLVGIVVPQAFDAGGTWQLNWTLGVTDLGIPASYTP